MDSNLSPQGTKLSFNNIHAGQLILQYVKYDIFSKRTLHLEQLPRKDDDCSQKCTLSKR